MEQAKDQKPGHPSLVNMNTGTKAKGKRVTISIIPGSRSHAGH